MVDDFGTEEYVDAGVTASTPTRDVAVPVGHDTFYPQDMRKRLEQVLSTYVALPAIPTNDGAYTLKCTVSSGVPTLTWESAT